MKRFIFAFAFLLASVPAFSKYIPPENFRCGAWDQIQSQVSETVEFCGQSDLSGEYTCTRAPAHKGNHHQHTDEYCQAVWGEGE